MRTYEVADLVRDIQPGEYWVKGQLRLIDYQQLYYIACSACRQKVKAKAELEYRCFLCKENAIATARLFVELNVIDQIRLMEIASTDQVAEKLLQSIAKDIAGLHSKYELTSIKEELASKTFLMMLKKTTGINSEMNLRMFLQEYYDLSVPTIQAGPNSPTDITPFAEKEIELSLSPL